MNTYLDFEKPIEELNEQLDKSIEIQKKNNVDLSPTIADLQKKIEKVKKNIYCNLSPWQKVQLSRHPNRPYTLSYIKGMCGENFIELFGDRNIKDDKAIVGGFGLIDGQTVMLIGHQKGITTKMRQFRNFGMANPEGYRKALRLMKLAEKFNKPIVTLIDTPGAYPGLEAEEKGQGEAIARNIYEMFQLKVTIICIVIGEGASGGALGLGVGDEVLMLENTWYSVISPESCSSILWRSWDYKEKAANELQLTAQNMYKNKLIDGIIKEPLGGAHSNYDETHEIVKKEILKRIKKLSSINPEEKIKKRIKKFSKMGHFVEQK